MRPVSWADANWTSEQRGPEGGHKETKQRERKERPKEARERGEEKAFVEGQGARLNGGSYNECRFAVGRFGCGFSVHTQQTVGRQKVLFVQWAWVCVGACLGLSGDVCFMR